MELHHHYFFILLSLAFIASHAANLSPEVYWKVKLPNTPVPKPIMDALQHSETSEGDDVHKLRQPYGVFAWNQTAAENSVHKLRQPYAVFAWYQAAAEGDAHKLRPPYGVFEPYNSATKKNLYENNLPITAYFFETDLHQGKKMNIRSLKNYNPAPFLPRKFADSIPFSSENIEEILNNFSINKDSEIAKMIKKSIKWCENPAGNGEEKYCATSLESTIDFASSYLGTNNIIAMFTEVEKETPEVQTYTIEEVKEKANGRGVICHKIGYPYIVHYCHSVGTTRTFMVSMVGSDGTKVNAVAECHEDTTRMNPNALPFQVLNVKPGEKPICHFILDDQIAFVPSQDATNYQVAEN